MKKMMLMMTGEIRQVYILKKVVSLKLLKKGNESLTIYVCVL